MRFAGRGITRRDALKLGLLGGVALTIPAGIVASRASSTASSDPLTTLPEPFQAPFSVPPVLQRDSRTRTTDYYRIAMKQADAEIIPGLSTRIWGYNGLFPGPTIRTRSGRAAVVRFANKLPEGMVVHNHGAYADGNNDGHPADVVRPGTYKNYAYNNLQNARTMWYHDHVMDLTSPHVYKGLAGFFLIRDDFEDGLPLPEGPYDVPIMIQDRSFNSDGSFSANHEVPGNVMLVNGKPQPRFEVEARRYRLRFLNASNVESFELALDSGEPLNVIATEGGLLEAPVSVPSLPIVPAERYEAVVDFSAYPAGTRVVLKNLESFRPSTDDVMCFDVVPRQSADDSSVPATLRPPEAQRDATHLAGDPDSAVRTRRWTFEQTMGHWTINGKMWDEDRIDAAPREKETEIWEFVNEGGVEHPAHVHLVNFKVLDRNGNPPFAYENGWKEMVSVEPFQTVRVLIKWPKVPVGSKSPYVRRYPFHCHQLAHEDHMMMAQFKVKEPL